MSQDEIKQMEMAQCKCCLLSTLKDCPNCKFNWVLKEEKLPKVLNMVMNEMLDDFDKMRLGMSDPFDDLFYS